MADRELSEATVLDALRSVQDPDLHRDIVSLGFIKDLRIEGGRVSFKLELTTPACPVKDQLKAECSTKVAALPGVTNVDVEMTARTRQVHVGEGEPVLEAVKNVVAVASGKGGVGKSTVAVNLALALQQTGAQVGLMDADVYGPSMGMMLDLKEQPQVTPERKLVPLNGYGMRVVSMGFLSSPDRPVIWRGPMVHQLVQQFVRDVQWGELDYLVIDLPPGTGDAQLSISQLVSLSGAVIVTTPQDVSLIDARKGLAMFRQLRVPVLGIVENMSYFLCPHCSERTEIFRHGGGRKTAEELGVPYLGEIPIDPVVVVGGDEGKPVLVSNPLSPASKAYNDLAGQVAAKLSILASEERPSHAPIMPGPMKWE